MDKNNSRRGIAPSCSLVRILEAVEALSLPELREYYEQVKAYYIEEIKNAENSEYDKTHDTHNSAIKEYLIELEERIKTMEQDTTH